MDLNEFARQITLKEGNKINLSIAQVKEVLRLTFRDLAAMKASQAMAMIEKYKK